MTHVSEMKPRELVYQGRSEPLILMAVGLELVILALIFGLGNVASRPASDLR